MRILRSGFRWCVLVNGLVLHHNLELLALREGYRVSHVCQELGVTEQHFRRIFQRDVGVPVKDWMRWERMVVARRLLKCGIPPVHIPAILGFTHANSFRREFREVYGMTVSDFLRIWNTRSGIG